MAKKVEYQILKSVENVEIRKYPKLLMATVTGMLDNDAFGILFNYISGSNRNAQKVEMTAPVISSVKLEMTAPVISTKNSFSFVLPPRFNISNIPQPVNPHIIIEEKEAAKIAVIRFKGYAKPKDVQRFTNKLLSILKKNNIHVEGETFLMRYNSPFAPGFIRRNEVGINILD
jgi:hypothetical protein